jgi:hypothetical protein
MNDLVNRYGIYVSQMTTDTFCFVTVIIPAFSSMMTCHLMFEKNNKTCITSGAGTTYLPGAPVFYPIVWRGSCSSIFRFPWGTKKSLFVCYVRFHLAIVLSVIWCTASDYPFGIFQSLMNPGLTLVNYHDTWFDFRLLPWDVA